MSNLAALLLTGGRSRRMGRDKALIEIGGISMARRLADMLGEVAFPVVEVGPGYSGGWAARETPPGGGPLAAVAAGSSALDHLGHTGPALVLACDLPLVTVEALRLLAHWPGPNSVIPIVDGRAQPLCARWSTLDLRTAGKVLAAGERSLRHSPDRLGAVLLDETQWGKKVGRDAFMDVDTPRDLADLIIHTKVDR